MIRREYERWLERADEASIEALRSMSADEALIEDSFYRHLEFGTGGLRGVIGVGTNRMNIYTVSRATLGLGEYVIKNGASRRVAIGYDTRRFSREFAKRAAVVLASMGIKPYIYSEPLPTPMLSFAVRELSCDSGIMITASHNPAEYNGYKVYGSDGCQITDKAASEILASINSKDYFEYDGKGDFDSLVNDGSIEYVSESVIESYLDAVKSTGINDGDVIDKSVGIVYTNLNGTGIVPVQRILSDFGFENLSFVDEQKAHDGNFPTCPYPNPEIAEALSLGIKRVMERGADILLATDPDCDRVGVAVRRGDNVSILTGNEIGLLLFDYIASARVEKGRMPASPLAVKTIVTTDLADKIASAYGVEMVNVLTGFKYIGEVIGGLEAKGESERYIFGFEESCGYLGGSYVRDKDGVFAARMISEMTAYYKKRGMTIADRLDEIYATYGYAKSSLYSYEFKGSAGSAKMQEVMQKMRGGVSEIAGVKVNVLKDYSLGIDGLPKSNVLKYYLANSSSVVLRPSGTEPKLKVYVYAVSKNAEEATLLTNRIKTEIEAYL